MATKKDLTTQIALSGETVTLPELFAQLRRESGLSFQQLSDRTGISVAHVYGIEKGTKSPSRDYLICLASAMALDPERTNDVVVAGGHLPLAPFIRKRSVPVSPVSL